MKITHLFSLFKKAGVAWMDDFAPSMGAAISYYTVFSLAPLLVIVIAIAGAVFGRDAVTGQIVAQLSGLIGQDGAEVVQGLVKAASDTDKGLVAGLVSVVVLLIGATTVFAELQSALDRIWHVPVEERPSGLRALLMTRLVSFGLILGVAFLLMVSLSVSAGLAAFGSWAGELFPGWELLLQLLNIAISLSVGTLLFAMIYKLMPSTPIAWKDVWIGAGVTAVLFEVGKLLIGLYLGKSGVNETFAAAGSLVVLLAWVYYAAQVFLLGAEFTKVYADDHGSRSAAKAMRKTEQTGAEGLPVEVPKPGPSVPATQLPDGQAPSAAGTQLPDNRVPVTAVGVGGAKGAQPAVAAADVASGLSQGSVSAASVAAGSGSAAKGSAAVVAAASQSVDIGKPVVTQTGGTKVVTVPVAPRGQKAIESELEIAKKALVTQVISLVAMTVLDVALSQYAKRMDKRISLRHQARKLARNRSPVGRALTWLKRR
ncbi:MAG: YihY/virulence factor BrkB family protein [Ramlibacter sp.]|nr:YihY/virulence factor BrkB family protein [Ramlibacter sp.]